MAKFYSTKLNNISKKPKIGISWRSGKLSSLRNVHYTNLKDWGSIFELSDKYDFVNLQYGDCEEELLEVEKIYNFKIHRWNELDLKNDIDSVYSLISSLDYVVSIGSAVAAFAGSVGTKVLLMYKKSWANFGTDGYPAFANVEVLRPEKDSPVATVIPIAAHILNSEIKNINKTS